MSTIRHVGALLLALVVASPAHAEKRVWTCYDANGHKTIQDQPCPASAQAEQPADSAKKNHAPIPPEGRKPSRFAWFTGIAVLGAVVITALRIAFARRRAKRTR